MPLKSSHLRQVSNGSSSDGSTIQSALQDAVQENVSDIGATLTVPIPRTCTLHLHDDAFSKVEVLVNPQVFPSWKIKVGTRIRIAAIEDGSPQRGSRKLGGESRHARRQPSAKQPDNKLTSTEYVFVVDKLTPEVHAKHPNLQLSLTSRIASAMGFRNASQVVASMVDEADFTASHVEIAFRDAYLTRADMWRMVVSHLAGRSMYKGQKLVFLNTIKAQIKTIYRQGEKQQSAFFGKETKPIFRSESARYVLFVQMSKEMWDFDTDGTGDIMFHKVIDGFLPELFRRWQDIGARHLVSVILFTRMEYERPLVTSLEPQAEDRDDSGMNYETEDLPYKDFYRVLISDMSSGSWGEILGQLKKEFRTFLRDVSIRKDLPTSSIVYGQDDILPHAHPEPIEMISGKPTSASKGNILEAINVASTQFASDYIDRDLIRTNLSIIVVTPGTGVFEVDYNLLSLTTDVLIENGVGIDLVCLSRMPLHSVPLFKYKRPKSADTPSSQNLKQNTSIAGSRLASSFGSVHSYLDPAHFRDLDQTQTNGQKDPWHYGVPHWVDVSFWTPNSQTKDGNSAAAKFDLPSQKPFVPRVRMYEVQMMGIMENEMSNISIPYMSPPKFDDGLPPLPEHAKLQSSQSISSMSSSYNKEESLFPSTSSAYSSQPPSPSNKGNHDPRKLAALINWMDEHDEQVFLHPQDKRRKKATSTQENEQSTRTRGTSMPQRSATTSLSSSIATSTGKILPGAVDKPRATQNGDKHVSRKSSISSLLSPAPKSKLKPEKLPRQFSFGFRGFGAGAAKATPVTEVSSDHALSDSLTLRAKRAVSPRPDTLQRVRSNQPKSDNEQQVDHSQGGSHHELHQSEPYDVKTPNFFQSSTPISIKPTTKETGSPRLRPITDQGDYEKVMLLQEKVPIDKDDGEADLDAAPMVQGLSPGKAMAPWLTVLNPWNPSSAVIDPSRRLGRWQHVFPKPLYASHMKWKSLCSPASVPLTTEGFPTKDQLVTEYDKTEYTVVAHNETELLDENAEGAWLMREMISARFSFGFQIVLCDRLVATFKLPKLDSFTIYDDKNTTSVGAKVFMMRGSNVHLLHAVEKGKVHITLYHRRPVDDVSGNGNELSFIYRPSVKTILAPEYTPREVIISPSKGSYDWKRLDEYTAGHDIQHIGSYSDLLRFWRARYVLIPIEQSSGSRRRAMPTNEDNDEEIRLEGIRKLTQHWQKNKYTAPKDRRFHSTRKREDANPLDIIYHTSTPSAIVAAEMHQALLLENEPTSSKPAQLLPDSDLFERSDLDIKDLANTIQSERGIRMMDRRWHWRLHYNCFTGMELTTWLLNNFRDVDTREEAVELGNELMKEGLFVHVEKRHNFRDGNFFYQVAGEHRLPRAEAVKNTWFGKSVPSTPMSEMARHSPRDVLPKSSNDDSEDSDGDTTPVQKQKLGVALSKKLIYDVDHRKRSYRPELIALHYDRISSADDCYHLRIDWMNVTPKLIEDAIDSWASLAERNGLRLIEVPIHEASRINDFHPFRGPYMIKLAKPPPDTQPQNYFDATSLGTTKSQIKHVYHKAILRKFNFVLDLESVSEFPASVDVEYSWGKPDYRYPQYISREGILLIQITDNGDFLLLANRMFNNRSANVREAARQQGMADANEAAHRRSPARVASSARLYGAGSPRQSPAPSPMIRASADVGVGMGLRDDLVTPENIKNELEAFCSDAKKLEKFYDEVLNKLQTPGSQTPALSTFMGTPRTAVAGGGLEIPPKLSLQ
jgi:hypothetical protein